MLMIITGTRCAGKSTIEDYLTLQKGFTILHLASQSDPFANPLSQPNSVSDTSVREEQAADALADAPRERRSLTMQDRATMLDYVTRNWQTDFVTTVLDGTRPEVLAEFVRRPFCAVLHVDAPLLVRWKRAQEKTRDAQAPLSLESFVSSHDDLMFGSEWDAEDDRPRLPISGAARALAHPSLPATPGKAREFDPPTLRPSLIASAHLVTLRISNRFPTKQALYNHLDALDIIRPDRLRPTWDDYFMTLAELAARRSNCMKRRVGAILVRGHHIVATGYNGTARGLANCKDGGCAACNLRRIAGEEKLNECICLHAEENALLEAGRDRVFGSILYCNTCPCLRCSVKIIQTGVKEVVYNFSYKVDAASAQLFKDAGVLLRRHVPPPSVHQ